MSDWCDVCKAPQMVTGDGAHHCGEIGELEIHSGTMFVMDDNGDTRLQWNRNEGRQVSAAKQRFDELKARGYLAYKVNKSGDRGEVINAFDASAERIIMAPQMVGG